MSRASLPRPVNKWSRRLHRWSAIAIAAPLLVIVATGLLLLWKKDVAWIQPPSATATAPGELSVGFDALLAAIRAVPEAEVASWEDVERLDVRPDKSLVKARCRNGFEVQLDGTSGAVLQVRYRRSDLIEALHDGSWFHERAKLGVFFPTALVLLFLWLSGIYLWILPIWARRRSRARRLAKRA